MPDGGLLSYGPDGVDIFRRAATYGHLEKLISMPIRDLASVNIYESEREQSRIIRRQFCGATGRGYFSRCPDAIRLVGTYVGHVHLPVFQSTKFELIINQTTAKALGLTVPETLLATADEVIR